MLFRSLASIVVLVFSLLCWTLFSCRSLEQFNQIQYWQHTNTLNPQPILEVLPVPHDYARAKLLLHSNTKLNLLPFSAPNLSLQLLPATHLDVHTAMFSYASPITPAKKLPIPLITGSSTSYCCFHQCPQGQQLTLPLLTGSSTSHCCFHQCPQGQQLTLPLLTGSSPCSFSSAPRAALARPLACCTSSARSLCSSAPAPPRAVQLPLCAAPLLRLLLRVPR